MVHETIRGPINHRDASNTSGCNWRNPPTPISVPANEHLHRPSRPHDNPYSRMTNTLDRRPGNPNVRQTVLAKAYNGYHDSHAVDARVRKRQKLDASVSSAVTFNGASSSYDRVPARSNVSEPGIQLVERSRTADTRSNHVPNDAEIVDLAGSSDDLGERVPRPTKSLSPDPILLQSGRHAFETHPAEYNSSTSNKGKGRAKELSELVVEGSEEEEDIEQFPSAPPAGWPSNPQKSEEIPKNIVHDRRKFFESVPAPAPAAIRHPTEKVLNSVDLTTGTVISRMKKKDEGNQRSTGVYDDVGTSSSHFVNSPREREKTQTLPLDAWCLGHHRFEHPESAPLKLVYEVSRQQVKVVWGQSPPKRIDFKLDRDVCSVMIVNDSFEPLRENVVIKFITTPGHEWKEAERKYTGFKGGGERGREVLAFLFSTAEDRGFSATSYQKLVTGIKKAFPTSAVEIVRPSKGKSIWEYASQCAAMFERTERRKGKRDRSESIVDEPPVPARSVTPGSSTSVKACTSCPELKPSNGDSGLSMTRRRSSRQSATRCLRASPPPPPPAQLEPDEVMLLYPPTGTGALSIMQSDLRRLQPEEYLNDTLIEFGLKLWLNELRGKDPALADQIHVFSSFFYKKLNNKKNPEDGYKSVRKWTSKVDLFAKKYVIVPINENIHWYLAIIYEPGHTLEPPLPHFQISNARTTRKRKQKKERAEANVETAVVPEFTPTEAPLDRSTPAAQVSKWESEADTSFMDAARAMTPSTIGNEELHDVAITVSDKSCSVTPVLEPAPTMSSEKRIRDSSLALMYPPSDAMDVDTDISVTSAAPNATCEVAETLEPSTSKLSSGIPVGQFYKSKPKPGNAKPIVVGGEDSGEDQQQEAEVDDMLAVTQSSSGDLLPQTYIFTLDSLGTRHPQAIKVLKQYLLSEAKDKRNFDEVRDAVGKQVQVPVQPNTWDCGIYLLHFVKVFMSAPSEFLEQILSTRSIMPSPDRKKMWRDHEIPQFRDNLKSRIIQLSEEWKAEKTVREEGASKRVSGDAPEVESLSSEGEVDIVEDIPRAKVTAGPRQKRPATRLRG